MLGRTQDKRVEKVLTQSPRVGMVDVIYPAPDAGAEFTEADLA